jgi:hypothetical protein
VYDYAMVQYMNVGWCYGKQPCVQEGIVQTMQEIRPVSLVFYVNYAHGLLDAEAAKTLDD